MHLGISPFCSFFYFNAFGNKPILFRLSRCWGAYVALPALLTYEEFLWNRDCDFPHFMCSLFPRASFVNLIILPEIVKETTPLNAHTKQAFSLVASHGENFAGRLSRMQMGICLSCWVTTEMIIMSFFSFFLFFLFFFFFFFFFFISFFFCFSAQKKCKWKYIFLLETILGPLKYSVDTTLVWLAYFPRPWKRLGALFSAPVCCTHSILQPGQPAVNRLGPTTPFLIDRLGG